MNAALLVAALLDGEDPKAFFRRMPRSSLPRMADVDFELEAEWEDDRPEDHFQFPEDIAFVRQQIENDNVWGWCSVHVTAKWTMPDGQEAEGDDWLGACSYESRDTFTQPGGMYDEMKAMAYDRLIDELKKRGIT